MNGFSTSTGSGFWLINANGSVNTDGNAHFYGDASSRPLNGPVVGGAVAPSGTGYWLVATDGGIFTFGSAQFHGSTGNRRLNQPVFSMAPTKDGHGYWLVARDGGIFTFGDAHYHGSMGGRPLNEPINGITTSPDGQGYRMVARDGGIFSFGDMPFYGSLPGLHLHVADVIGMAPTPTNKGYWIARQGGQVYAFGDARRFASYHASSCDPVSAIFSNPEQQGYRLVTTTGATVAFGTAPGGVQATGTQQCPYFNPKSEAAIAWFKARLGSSAYEERCESAVENAFGTTSQYMTARDDWLARPDQHLDWQNAPRGTLVFYSTSADGHVALSLGNGMVISTSVNHRIGIAPVAFFQNPLGWARAPW
jgi:ribosomal protein L24E